MNLLGMGTVEILVVIVVAFVFLGPERLVGLGRHLGKFARDLREMTSELATPIEELRTELTEIQEDLVQVTTEAAADLGAPIDELKSDLAEASSDVQTRVGEAKQELENTVEQARRSPEPAELDTEVREAPTGAESEDQLPEDDGPVEFRPAAKASSPEDEIVVSADGLHGEVSEVDGHRTEGETPVKAEVDGQRAEDGALDELRPAAAGASEEDGDGRSRNEAS